MNELNKEAWKIFADAGLFWWVNRQLHLFGWAIVRDEDSNGQILSVYPERCTFYGFTEEAEEKGFRKLRKYLTDKAIY